uniref:Nucleoprotein n=1 Tax=Orthomarburgvirus marburgense TaxID=3052505 RepID=K4N3C7_9MONO|nr:nucleoprotein [Orthomarburgvirus marburgense]AFV31150.1 nucleoprotein [Orthomarburgvirus marburgense]AFV31157.1 nucleoprotein [Orthomarburgvirus marburgense]AFV31171.1 nucleoprotein [Orthomarburgvirus marburgense]
MDLHSLLELGTKPTAPHVRNKKVILFDTNHQVSICNQIIDAINSGIDLGDLLEGGLLTLCVEHYYNSDKDKFNTSPIAKYLRDAGYEFDVIKNADATRFLDVIPNEPHYSPLILALKTLESTESQRGRIGLFLSFCSLFLPKLVVGDRASIEKALRQVTVHQEQGIVTYPNHWLTTGHMKVIFGILRSSFILKFVLIHQGVNLVTGHDAYDSIISNSVGQTRFSGLLIVKTVLEFILQKTDSGVTLHPLVRTSKVKNEVASFKQALSNLARHGEYAPFARVLNLSGINNLEHGLYPQLSAIALGVATAHGSTLAGVNVGEQYQQLREAAHDAEIKLQRRHEHQEIQAIAEDDEERKILEQFHLQKTEITHSQTLAVLSQKREKLARLAAEIENNIVEDQGFKQSQNRVSQSFLNDPTPVEVTVQARPVNRPTALPPPVDDKIEHESTGDSSSSSSFVDLNDPFALLNEDEDTLDDSVMIPSTTSREFQGIPESPGQSQDLDDSQGKQEDESTNPIKKQFLRYQELPPVQEDDESEYTTDSQESIDQPGSDNEHGVDLPPPPLYTQEKRQDPIQHPAASSQDPFGSIGDVNGDILEPIRSPSSPSAPQEDTRAREAYELSPDFTNYEDNQQNWPQRVVTKKGRTFLYPNDLLQTSPPESLVTALVEEYQNPVSAKELQADWPDMSFDERRHVAMNL